MRGLLKLYRKFSSEDEMACCDSSPIHSYSDIVQPTCECFRYGQTESDLNSTLSYRTMSCQGQLPKPLYFKFLRAQKANSAGWPKTSAINVHAIDVVCFGI
jgi:hypothetical protein